MGHVAVYDAIVSLMQDLDLLLSFFRRPFISQLSIITFLSKTITSIHSLLTVTDSSTPQTYHPQLISIFGNMILHVTCKAEYHVDSLICLLTRISNPDYGYPKSFRSLDVFLQFDNQLWTPETPIGYLEIPFPDLDASIALEQVVMETNRINEELKKFHLLPKAAAGDTEGNSPFTYLKSSSGSPKLEDRLVGQEEEMVEMLDSLTGLTSRLQVFAITGMGGIGKTTFVSRLYDHPLIVHHFYVHAWATLSQQYQPKQVLLGLLNCITHVSDEMHQLSHEDLSERLYRCLKGRRYFIVLDDMWDKKAWDNLRRCFPDDRNGSRIILTSRLNDVSAYAATPDVPPYCLRSLTPDESWELLCSKINFQNESCPSELTAVGKQIARRCQGLPVAIVVLGGILSKIDKNYTDWEKVAQRVGSLVMEDPHHCQNIFALSYNILPDPLKVCFLYLAIFPEDYEIHVHKLICLWIAEGFIIPTRSRKRLEEVGEEYLEDLIARSLVLVKRRRSNGKIKICYIHGLLREFCIREAQKENFLDIVNSETEVAPRLFFQARNGCREESSQANHNILRRLAFHSATHTYMERPASIPLTRSFFFFELLGPSEIKGCSGMWFQLLRTLDIMNVHLEVLPHGLKDLTRLRYLAVTIQNSFQIAIIFKLVRLQTLLVGCKWEGHLPREFCDMVELRHVHIKKSCISYSVNKSKSSSCFEMLADTSPVRRLEKLQTLSTVRPTSCTKEIFQLMPNLKKLGIFGTEEDRKFCGWSKNLVQLRELESLKYIFSNPFLSPLHSRESLPSLGCFPPKLVKITLSGTAYKWEDMHHLSILPRLEVLKLNNYACSGAVWKPREGGFLRLKFLLIGSTNLEHWEADSCHFPSLEHLVLKHCRCLKEIPIGIGEAPLLKRVELHSCGDAATSSARQLQEEQLNMGNDFLKVYITERNRWNPQVMQLYRSPVLEQVLDIASDVHWGV